MICSCHSHKNEIISLYKIQEMVKGDNSIFLSPNKSFNLVYTIGVNDSIYTSNLTQLNILYQNRYKHIYNSFEYFLHESLNQQIKIDFYGLPIDVYYIRKFRLNPTVTCLYKKEGINGIIDKYAKYRDRGYTLKDDVQFKEIYSISYYFFINAFYTVESDDILKVSYISIDYW